ncbi:deoxyguanosinetriphosphate triphosphohydrolase family protein [Loktanella agnita]|uniref:deoxyguanosinetriphosphate triphosphohydrolase family protein n=1 Tax=Loktanella agnita TaxID=287097 RepID=UPI003989AEE2
MGVNSKYDRKGFFAQSDYRSGPERDRDRILFSSALHRLAGVSQIVNASDLSNFHTRYQHTIKVAQVGRRLAEALCAKDEDRCMKLDLNADIVEAACLAHDLGHPPFGHVGEHTLNDLAQRTSFDPSGQLRVGPIQESGTAFSVTNCFEGNAQTFRILTKLAVRFPDRGMNLMRATLAACLKYPWLRDGNDHKKKGKWGAYHSEKEQFEFARELETGEAQTIEAHVMDWADDIAYSVHDLEEFHRCNFFDWREIFHPRGRSRIVEAAERRWFNSPADARDRLSRAFDRVESLSLLYPRVFCERYTGSRWQRYELRNLNSLLVSRYIEGAYLVDTSDSPTGMLVPDNHQEEVLILKELTKQFVLTDASILSQQRGHKRIISKLYTAMVEDVNAYWIGRDENDSLEDYRMLNSIVPERLRYLWAFCDNNPVRFILDCIASLTEAEAMEWHRRLEGTSSNSILDPIMQ